MKNQKKSHWQMIPSATAAIILICCGSLITSCANSVTNQNNSPSVNSNFNSSSNNTANQKVASLNDPKTIPEVNLDSPTAAHKAFVRATFTKNLELYKRSMSKALVKEHFQKDADKKNITVDEEIKDYLNLMARVTSNGKTAAKPDVYRNEIISGNKATLEMKTDDGWMVLRFVKEDGEWKFNGGD